MRRSDIDLLSRPYAGSAESDLPEERFADALSVGLPATRALAASIRTDLAPDDFGVGWWKAFEPAFGVRARILVSDQLYRSAASIETNIVEAKLHLLEAQDAWERIDKKLARMVTRARDGSLRMAHPPSLAPADDLADRMAALHVAGFFRALASGLDCLGTCITGILALPGLWILKASLGTARGALKNLSPRDQRRIDFREDLDALVRGAGPADWLDWALHYRHMLVHRARRVEMNALDVSSHIVDQHGQPIIRAKANMQLIRNPGRSDVEAWRTLSTQPPVLTEPARVSMEEVLRSALHTIEGTSTLLMSFWSWRKSAPMDLPQPPSQWANADAGEAVSFPGYAPQSFKFEPKMMSSHEINLQRIKAASLADADLPNWPDFGGDGDNR